MTIDFLIIAGSFSFIASAIHICIIIGGPSWYRFFGAGESMALMAEKGSLKPVFITLAIASILTLWGVYAWSGANILPSIPFTKSALTVVTIIYLSRGLVGLLAPFLTNHPKIRQNSKTFWIWSSSICLAIGLFHLLGIISKWSNL